MKGLVLRACAFLLSLFLLVNRGASALTIDEFNDGGPASAAEIASASPSTASSNIFSTSAVGGNRVLFISRSSAFNGGTTRIFSNSRLFHSQDGGVRAFSRVTWDRDSSASNSVISNGLPAIDLTQDGGDSIKIVTTFDYANAQPIDITLRLYDSNDLSGNTFSQVSITLNQVLTDFELVIPFAKFSSPGASTIPAPTGTFSTYTFFPDPPGPANLSRIGAIVLEINGQKGDSDISLDSIATNGQCAGVPDAQGDVIDECGVCIGQPNYKLPKDDCGICPGEPFYNESKDECGVCVGATGYNNSKDDCGVCFGNNAAKDSCGVCFGNDAAKDDCGVCFGGNLSKDSCQLCPSHPNFNRAKDPCGVCFGDGSSCADCKGVPNGSGRVDICGVCAGNGTTCLDCKGVPFGVSGFDSCNICGGDGKSCLDCKGVPFGTAKVDACGVCGGSATNVSQCVAERLCVTVQATSEILAFERRLLSQARTITRKFFEEDRRNKRNSCGINTTPAIQRVNSAFETIAAAGKEIFTKGVQICGNECITVSFADQVQALAPTLRRIKRETTTLARRVQNCYRRKRISSRQGTAGVAKTIRTLDSDLKQLIKDCKDKRVCPK